MSHDTDKLIRQLSLVAFLMAERRPLTARDVKQNVEGYQEMSDEAFARRFYSDRAELIALGVPLDSQRDEFTGEELYTPELGALLPAAARADRRGARGAADLPLPARGPVRLRGAAPPRAPEPRARPAGLRRRRRPRPRARVELHDPGYSPELPGRLAKLEGAISKKRTLKFEYWSIMRDEQRRAHGQPLRAALRPRRSGTSSASTSTTTRIKTFRVSRIRGDIRLATRRERDFRLPEGFDAEEYRQGPPWQVGEIEGRGADRGRAATRPGGSTACSGATARSRTASSSRDYSDLGQLSSWILRQDGRAVPLGPPELGARCARTSTCVHKRHDGQAAEDRRRDRRGGRRRGGAAGEPGAAGALRAAPGPARVPARPLRRRHARA